MTNLDLGILFGSLVLLVGIAVACRRLTRSVADFLAADRCAGRYLLCGSQNPLVGPGLVFALANFEKFYQAGFAASWWGLMLMPVGMIVALSGWVAYRYRETRAMTMAQFFEMRYSRRFRIFSGIVGWCSGLLNYGIFPAVAARFFVVFCQLPESYLVGGVAVSTQLSLTALLVVAPAILAIAGGMVTILVCYFLQAQFVNLVFVIAFAYLITTFAWPDIIHTLSQTAPGKSLLDPFDQAAIADFNPWFFALFAFKAFYNKLGWQAWQGFNCAARTPHESRMAGILGEWSSGVTYFSYMLLPICAYVLLHSPAHLVDATAAQQTLAAITDPTLQKQMTTPAAMQVMLPVGLVGLVAAALLLSTITSDALGLHAWGSMLIQDVILPFRKRALSTAAQLGALRWSVIGVSIFAILYSHFFPLRDYILMYQLVTGAIYLAGSGAVIIGGLYWSRGTTAGAWAAMITGLVLALVGGLLKAIWPDVPALVSLRPDCPWNGAWVAFVASVAGIVAFIGVSLVTCRTPHDMDRLLHRGRWADADSPAGADAGAVTAAPAPPKTFWTRIGVGPEFTAGDRFIYLFKILWTTFWTGSFILGTIAWFFLRPGLEAWATWWLITLIVGGVVGLITVIWFLWGGIRDLRDLVRHMHRDQVKDDNGQVSP